MGVSENSFHYVWLDQHVKFELQSYFTLKLRRQFFSNTPQSFCMAPLKFQPGAATQLYLPRGLLIYAPCPGTHGKVRTRDHSLCQNGQSYLDPLRTNKALKKCKKAPQFHYICDVSSDVITGSQFFLGS